MLFDHAAARTVVKQRATANENERQQAARCRSLLACGRNYVHPDTDVVTNGLGRFD
jgi:hypothetical protein